VKNVSSSAQSTSIEDDSDDDSPAVMQPVAAAPLREPMQPVESPTDRPVRSTRNPKAQDAHSIRGAKATTVQATKSRLSSKIAEMSNCSASQGSQKTRRGQPAGHRHPRNKNQKVNGNQRMQWSAVREVSASFIGIECRKEPAGSGRSSGDWVCSC
jgi:hypothetical protein